LGDFGDFYGEGEGSTALSCFLADCFLGLFSMGFLSFAGDLDYLIFLVDGDLAGVAGFLELLSLLLGSTETSSFFFPTFFSGAAYFLFFELLFVLGGIMI
jgi:hypothetical protein